MMLGRFKQIVDGDKKIADVFIGLSGTFICKSYVTEHEAAEIVAGMYV